MSTYQKYEDTLFALATASGELSYFIHLDMADLDSRILLATLNMLAAAQTTLLAQLNKLVEGK